MAITWEDDFCEMLERHDIQGSMGCKWPLKNNSLLVSPVERVLTEDSIALRAKQFFPEGLGFHHFAQDFLDIPADQDAGQVILIDWQHCSKGVPNCDEKVFLYKLKESHSPFGADFTFGAESMFFPLRDSSSKHIHMLEFFAGGYGGWKRGSQILADVFGQSFRTIGLEQDLHVATTYAISHGTKLVNNVGLISPKIFRNSNDNWILRCDIWDDEWIPIASEWGTDVAVISSPCKPWSGAAKAPGLSRPDGQLLVRSILACRFLRPRCIAIEQVPGFCHHDHKKWVMKALVFCGYHLVWSRILDLADQSPSFRPRWLGVAIRLHEDFPPMQFHKWLKQPVVTPVSVEAVWQFAPEDISPLQVSSEAIAVASDKSCFRGSSKHVATKEAVLSARVYHGNTCLPTFMAMYGSQHCMDLEYLQQHGFFGHYKSDSMCPHDIRHWHPVEIALIHGITSPCFIDEILAFSWMILGNMIAQPHALIVLVDICNRCFGQKLAIDEVMTSFQNRRFRASNCELFHIQGGLFVLPRLTAIGSTCPHRGMIFRLNVEQLLAGIKTNPHFDCWTPEEGIVALQDLCPPDDAISLVSVVEISPTMPIAPESRSFPRLDWSLANGVACLYFVQGDIPFHSLSGVWGDQITIAVVSTGLKAQILLKTSVGKSFSDDPRVVVVSKNGEFSILYFQTGESLLASLNLPPGPCFWFDHFGKVMAGQMPVAGAFLCDFEIQHGSIPCDSPFMLAAFLQSQIHFSWSAECDDFTIHVQGSEEILFIFQEFWSQVVKAQDLVRLGREISIGKSGNQLQIHFTPIGDRGACPPQQFRQILSICAIRSLLDSLQSQVGVPITCKLTGRPLWAGLLPKELPVITVASLVQNGFVLIGGSLAMRLVCKGKHVNPDTLLQDLPWSQDKILLHCVTELSGGGPSKNQTRTTLRNALAGIFLEQGFDIQWVSVSVETLVNKIGIPRLQQVVNMTPVANQIASLHKLCGEVDIQIPGPSKQTSHSDFSSAPWNKKKTKKELAPVRATDFTITPGYFQHEDGSAAVQLPQLRAQACGVCILDPPQALEWLRGNNRISSDELGAFVLGQLPCETSLPTQQITAPCLNLNGQSVLLSGKFVQFGSKTIKFCKANHTTVQPENCQLFSITLQRDDWGQDDWNQAVNNPVAFIRKTLAVDQLDKSIIAIWGRSLRQGRSPSSPHNASSLQMHCTVASTAVDSILRQSGFNKLYMTPKEPTGKLDAGFKIVWVQGSLAEVTAVSASISDCLGLIRGKQTYGLRFRADKFETAWSKIFPGTPAPIKPQGDLLFKISGLPFGCTAGVVESWGKAQTWEIAAVKALGPQAWLVRSSSHPKDGIPMVNATPVLVQHLPPRSKPSVPVLLGPRVRSAEVDTLSVDDPWAKWTGSRPSISAPTHVPARQVTGPIEDRFKAQDDTISALRSELTDLANRQDEQRKLTEHRFQQAETREKKNLGQGQADMRSMQKDLEKSFAASLSQNTHSLDARLRELKELFSSAKRKLPSDEPME